MLILNKNIAFDMLLIQFNTWIIISSNTQNSQPMSLHKAAIIVK